MYCNTSKKYGTFNLLTIEYFWSFLQKQKHFTKICAQKPQFWSFIQKQKCFTNICAQKLQFWLLLQMQKCWLMLRPRGLRHCRAHSWFSFSSIQVFARDILLMKKLEIEETKTTQHLTFKTDIIHKSGLNFFDFQLFY